MRKKRVGKLKKKKKKGGEAFDRFSNQRAFFQVRFSILFHHSQNKLMLCLEIWGTQRVECKKGKEIIGKKSYPFPLFECFKN